jgi:hypothetical protein
MFSNTTLRTSDITSQCTNVKSVCSIIYPEQLWNADLRAKRPGRGGRINRVFTLERRIKYRKLAWRKKGMMLRYATSLK